MATLPNGSPLDIRAFDADGSLHDAKVLQWGDAHLLDINVLMAGPELPIRMTASDDAFLPVKANAADGKLMDVKATSPDGPKLEEEGVEWSGRIALIKAMGPGQTLRGVNAISPEGRMHDVEGVRMSDGPEKGKVAGFAISACIKFLPQTIAKNEDLIWNVKGIGTEWYPFGVKAIVKNRSVHEVKAFMENGDRWIMDCKALVEEKEVAVNMLLSDDALISVKAVAADRWIHLR